MRDWKTFIEESVSDIRAATNGFPVLAAISGGVDSTVSATLTHRAVGDRLTCIFVDHGLMRKGEADEVRRLFFEALGIGLINVDASDRFFARLKGVTDPEKKRMAIGDEFIRVFHDEVKGLGELGYLMMGTIKTDVTESGQDGGRFTKSHHNVGAMPEDMPFKGAVEPVRGLYKNEVRELGKALGIPGPSATRQSFPGPGLAIRVIGEVTRGRVALLQEADAAFREVMDATGIAATQYFAILTGLRSVGIVGGDRAYGETVALRALSSVDLISAAPVRVPYETLEKAASEITARCPGVNRVVYDITPKPPGTIEWE
ncbi:MAG: glutamine-hydrolyzing GMP synthase [Oscillospiraceae bacterium]|nr:glutamine-hydrolyzing GMP synthase [Oscillospiraceae bacterium]